MTQREKELLLRDLCARLPYGVNIQYDNGHIVEIRELGLGSLHDFIFNDVTVKSYLHPMSSMTEEEKKFYKKYFNWYEQPLEDMVEFIDWLNAHHFDYRGLIMKGLALEAPENMYEF